MKRSVLVLLAALGLAFAMNFSNAQSEKPANVLRHVVLFKFKSDATKEQVQKIVDDLAALPTKIDTIIGYEHGLNNSKEGRSKGFTHCFTITFKDEAGREKYLPHPAHIAFVDVALPLIDDVLVVDYWADPPAK
jgi:hypothetical protein